MLRHLVAVLALLLPLAAVAEDPAPAPEGKEQAAPEGKEQAAPEGKEQTAAAGGKKQTAAPGKKQMAGMSIVGNDDAPKSLVIVPWKSSEPTSAIHVASGLDGGRGPVDREVFLRELEYYEIRAASSGGESPAAR